MSTLPTQVRPGDPISSSLMNAILDTLANLQGGPVGTETVPNVFGMFLSDARLAIQQSGSQLMLGFTLDVSGAVVDPLAAANAQLVVLNQNPPADARVSVNTPVNMVVSRSAVGSGPPPPPPPPPAITRTETSGGVVSTTFPVGSSFAIVGNNFNVNPALDTVKFNNVAAASVAVDLANPSGRLLVAVPAGIPGAPVNPGDASLPGVQLTVQTPGASAASTTVTISAPVPNAPAISSVTPATQFETSDITIAGSNFGAAPTVSIRGVQAQIKSATASQIVATVPEFADVHLGDPPITVTLVVTVPGVGDVPFGGTFKVRGAN